ncbi:MAG: formate/nitrite transporter family protein [Deltaproteobacteria bacterium]|nr:formate/nitrite transporter family protein [Deltaproteobacteria bacterium]MBW2648248.1 formate/nitrite transporter family protein [Deltaproteobacteria bacterium]
MAFNTPAKMVALVGNAGVGKAKLSIFNLLLRGFMAGAYIAIGGALCTVCITGIATPGIAKLVGGSVFPVGLIAIVLTGMELFTGDCMIVPMAAMMKKITWGAVIRNWTWVYIGNLVGSLAYAYLMAVGPFVSGQADGTMAVNAFGMTAVGIATGKVLGYKAVGAMGLWSCFMKAIGCNFLVNIAILLAITADNVIGKFFGVWFPIMAFVSSGFEHVVANMYFLPAGKFLMDWYPAVIAKKGGMLLANGGLSWSDIWLWNLIPVTIGNIVGGFVFIGVAYFLMFRKELPAD